MSDVLADSIIREFESKDRQVVMTQPDDPSNHDFAFTQAKCPCCGALVRIVADRNSRDEPSRTKLEFISYKC